MPVSGPAGMLAFYILSAVGCPGLFYKTKSAFFTESTELAKYMAVPLCSIAAFIVVKHVCQTLYLKAKPVLPADQIVMDVKKMNINFNVLGGGESPTKMGKVKSLKTTKPSTLGVSFCPCKE